MSQYTCILDPPNGFMRKIPFTLPRPDDFMSEQSFGDTKKINFTCYTKFLHLNIITNANKINKYILKWRLETTNMSHLSNNINGFQPVSSEYFNFE